MKIGKNINTESFRFNFFLIYIYSAFISVIIIIFLFLYLKSIISTNNFYTEIGQPIVYQAQTSNVDINRHSSYIQSYLKFNNEEHKAIAEERLFEKLPGRLTTIIELSAKFNDPTFVRMADDLRDQLIAIQTTYDKFSDPEVDKDELLEKTYLPMLIKYGLDMKAINNYHYDNYGHDLVNVFSQIDKYKYWALLSLIGLFSVLGIIINRTRRKIKVGINKLQDTITIISKGNIPEKIVKSDNELVRIELALISLVENLENVKGFAQEVGKGVFDSELSVFGNTGDLGQSLSEMRESLKKVADESKIRDWINTGLANFSGIIHEHSKSIDELSNVLISELVKYTDSVQGGLFLVNSEDEENVFLELSACYAYERKKFINKMLMPGEGYVGQVYLEKKSILMNEVPNDYVYITSGLGKSNPSNIIIQPMIANEKVEGIIELASFNQYPEHVLDFLKQISDTIAVSISTAKTSDSMEKMITDARELTEQLQSQEEELRQNTEELQATQEDMERRIRELEEENKELKANLEEA